MREGDHVVERQAHPFLHGLADLRREPGCLREALCLLDFEGENDPFSVALHPARVASPEGHDVPLTHAGNLAGLPLHVLRVIIAPVDDHDLLASSADVKLTAAHEPEVPG